MADFIEFHEVQKTATGRGPSTLICISRDQIVAVRPTQHFKETSITLTNGTVLVEGGLADTLKAVKGIEAAAKEPAAA